MNTWIFRLKFAFTLVLTASVPQYIKYIRQSPKITLYFDMSFKINFGALLLFVFPCGIEFFRKKAALRAENI